MRLLTPVQDMEGQSSSVLLLDSLNPMKGARELPQSESSGSDGPVEVEPLKQGPPASRVTITASISTRKPISHASDSTRSPTGPSGLCVRTSSSPKTHFTFNIPEELISTIRQTTEKSRSLTPTNIRVHHLDCYKCENRSTVFTTKLLKFL